MWFKVIIKNFDKMGIIISVLKVFVSVLLLGIVVCISLLIFCFVGFFLQRNKRIESSESYVDCSGDDWEVGGVKIFGC